MSDRTFSRAAGVAAIIAAPIGVASFLLGPAAFGWDFNLLFAPEQAIRHPMASTTLIRLGWMLDIPGYYLLPLPAAVVLHTRSETFAPRAARLAWCAMLLYAITGTAGAAMLAGTTALMERFRVADVSAQTALVEIHVALFGMVVDGLWNLLSMSGLAVWGFSAGYSLRRDQRVLGVALQAIGVCAALDVVGHAVGLRTLGDAGLFGYLLAFPVFSVALGAWLLRADL